MKEIDQKKRTDNRWKSLAAVAIASAVGLGIGYAYQTGNNEELAQALSVANSKVSLLTSREKSLSTDLAEAKNKADSSNAESTRARDEILTLTQKLKQNGEQAGIREQGLKEVVASLTDEIAKTKTRANALAKAIDPAVLKEIDDAINVSKNDPRSSTKDATIARNRELLKKFTRMSDEFTRPRVYMHDHFGSIRKNKGHLSSFSRLTNLTINTSGGTEGEFSFKSLQILHGDDVLTFSNLGVLNQFLKNYRFSEIPIRCRLTWEEHDYNQKPFASSRLSLYNTVTKVEDLTLDKDYASALRESYDLAASFEELNELK